VSQKRWVKNLNILKIINIKGFQQKQENELWRQGIVVTGGNFNIRDIFFFKFQKPD